MVVGDIPESADLVVIGGGPGGYVAAIRAAKLGLRTIIVEKDQLGGLCLNYGCIPSKALIHAAGLLEEMANAGMFGVKTPAPVSVDAAKMLEARKAVIKRLRDGVAFLLRKYKADFRQGEAFFESPTRCAIRTPEGLDFVDFKNAVIATGSVPRSLKVPGLEFDGKQVISSTEALELAEIPKRMLVVGGGFIGVELGGAFAKLGSKVTIVEGLPSILASSDADVAAVVKKRLAAMGVRILESAQIVSAERSAVVKVTVESGGKQAVEEADVVLVCVGHSPYTAGLAIEKAGVELDAKGFVKVDEELRTTAKSIFAVGDVVGNPMLAHKAFRQGKLAAEAIAREQGARDAEGLEEERYDARLVPSAVFSDPEISMVGLSEAQARKELDDNVLVGKFPLSASGRALTLGKTDGFAKVIARKDSHEIIGVEIVGPEASDLIGEAALAIEAGALLEDLAAAIHPHPTLSEALGQAAEAALGRAVDI